MGSGREKGIHVGHRPGRVSGNREEGRPMEGRSGKGEGKVRGWKGGKENRREALEGWAYAGRWGAITSLPVAAL